ncbi:phospholipase A2 [Streptomyces roseoverticillatus]|uniref:phospholipase A2 n=1 Tax=Streptomyces roseoverticillatus TaxID=66429 RepID=UPI0033CAC451
MVRDGCSWAPDRPMGFGFPPSRRRHGLGCRNDKEPGRFDHGTRLAIGNSFQGGLARLLPDRGEEEDRQLRVLGQGLLREGPRARRHLRPVCIRPAGIRDPPSEPGAGRPESGRSGLGRAEFRRPVQVTGHQPSENTVRCHGFRATAVISDMTCLIWVYSSNE